MRFSLRAGGRLLSRAVVEQSPKSQVPSPQVPQVHLQSCQVPDMRAPAVLTYPTERTSTAPGSLGVYKQRIVVRSIALASLLCSALAVKSITGFS